MILNSPHAPSLADKSHQKNEALLADKDSIINQKNKEIESLKSQMEDMAQEFGEMLKVRKM